MPIGAAVAGQTGVHEPQAVEQLGPGAKGAADARHAGPLVQGQRSRNVQHLVHARPGGLSHPAAGVGGQGIQVAPGALRIQHAQCQRGFAGAGHARNAHDLVQWDVHINVLEVVDMGIADLHRLRNVMFFHGFSSFHAVRFFLIIPRTDAVRPAEKCPAEPGVTPVFTPPAPRPRR